MTEKIDALVSIRSGERFAAENHEANLNAITSQPLSVGDVAETFNSDQKFYILQRLGYENLDTFDDLPPEAVFMMEKIASLDINEAVEILRESLETFDGDLNVRQESLDFIEKLVAYDQAGEVTTTKQKIAENFKKSDVKESVVSVDEISSGVSEDDSITEVFDWNLQAKTEAGLIAFWSIYPEVRSVTQPFDDPSTPCETFRVYFLGLLWTVIGSFIIQFFSERRPAIGLGTSVVQLFLFPCGKFLEYVLPAWDIKIWKWKFNLNPGPWSGKEQMLATLTYSVSGGAIYVSWNLHNLMLDRYYGVKWVDCG